VPVPHDPGYYATVAQVIPTLLLAAALEHRLLGADQRDPSAQEVKDNYSAYLSTALFVATAVAGEFLALQAMYVGGGPTTAKWSFVGLITALVLVLMPVVLRAVATLLIPVPRVRTYFLRHLLPALLIALAAWGVLSDV
jgi:hypothetical protein